MAPHVQQQRGHMHTALRSQGPPVAVKDVCACVHPMTGPEDLLTSVLWAYDLSVVCMHVSCHVARSGSTYYLHFSGGLPGITVQHCLMSKITWSWMSVHVYIHGNQWWPLCLHWDVCYYHCCCCRLFQRSSKTALVLVHLLHPC